MTRIGRRLATGGLFAALYLVGTASARADVDAGGQWFLQFLYYNPYVETETWVQTGSVLTTSSGWTGTIDPHSGVFSMTMPSEPTCGPCPTCCVYCPDYVRTGTVAADSMTFTATEFESFGSMCHGISSPFYGSRYMCGNGIIDPTEECDDGNNTSGDGCDRFCQVERCYVCSGQPSTCSLASSGTACDSGNPCMTAACDGSGMCVVGVATSSGTPCDSGNPCATAACDGSGMCVVSSVTNCDDGNPCTVDACGTSGCTHVPDVRSCRSAGKSTLLVEVVANPSRNRLRWKWLKGQSTSDADIADPQTTANYTLCVFAGTTAAVVGHAAIPPSPTKWQPIDSHGFRYKDPSAAANGITQLILKSSSTDRAKVVLKGNGAALAINTPPLDLPLTVQLTNGQTEVCWSAAYDSSEVQLNQSGVLQARSSMP